MRSMALLTAATVATIAVSASAAPIDFQSLVSPTNGFISTDVMLRQDHVDSNYSSSTYLYLGSVSTSKAFRIVLSFDLKATGGLSAGDTISAVTLSITKQADGNGAWETTHPTMQVQQLTRDFDYSKATWNDAAASTPWTTAGGDFSATVLSTVSETAAVNAADTFSSTANFVAAAQDALDHNNGILNLIIRVPSEENSGLYASFWSARTGTKSYHPLLQVTTVPEPASGAMILVGGIGALTMRRRK